jgi:hypothetical protein
MFGADHADELAKAFQQQGKSTAIVGIHLSQAAHRDSMFDVSADPFLKGAMDWPHFIIGAGRFADDPSLLAKMRPATPARAAQAANPKPL